MIYEISRQLQTELQSKGVPCDVVYGPEGQPERLDLRVVVERNRKAVDISAGPTSQHASVRTTKGAKLVDVRTIAARVRLYARSSLPGARIEDHERVADQMADKVTVALRKIATQRNTKYAITGFRMLEPSEFEHEFSGWSGVVYQGEFSVDRGVYDTEWSGEGPETAASCWSIASTTMVAGSAGCGGS